MAKFQTKGDKGTPKVNTASLPDIIFILLFFFMVVTVMKESPKLVDVTVPQATELTKLEKKSLVSYIYIGKPVRRLQKRYGDAPRVQLNDVIIADVKSEIIQFIENERKKVSPAKEKFMTTSLRVDMDVTMGIVSDVKQELRKANALKINYSARSR
ncbi:MAG: biopolymer transporter ExbD [Bacteroidetes bacterium]|nr:biopolymer transporter ExbD [Bacteroidota bacterium]